MRDSDKTKAELISELSQLRRQVTDLKKIAAEHNQAMEMLKWETETNSAIAKLSSILASSQMSIVDISSLVLEYAKDFTKSAFGYVGYIDQQTGYLISSTISRDIWDICQVAGKDVTFKEFNGLWGWVLNNRKSLLTNNPSTDPRSSSIPSGHIPIHRFLSVPALTGGELVGQISVANSENDYTEREQILVKRLAAIYAIAVQQNRTEEEHLKLTSAVEQSPSTIVITDTDGNIEYTNPRFTQITGYDPRTVNGENPRILKSGKMSSEEYRQLWETITNGGEWRGEFHNRKANGDLYWEIASISPIRNREGDITHFVKVAEDITALKRSEEELRKQRDHLADLVEDRTVELKAINEQLQYSYDIQTAINALLRLSLEDTSMENILERALDIILSVSWMTFEPRGGIFLVEDDPKFLAMKVYRGIEEIVEQKCAQIPFGMCICGRAALSQEIQFTAHVDEGHNAIQVEVPDHGHYCVPILYAGEMLGVIFLYLRAGHKREEREIEFLSIFSSVLAGMIARQQIGESLRQSTDSLVKAQRIANLGNWDWDIVNNRLQWSDEIYRIFGLMPHEFGATYEAFIQSVHPDDRKFVDESVNKALTEDEPYSIEHRIIHPYGSERVVHEQAEIFYDDTNQAIRMVGTVQDITERKHAEEELESQRVLSMHSDRLRSLGEMAAGIAHELNQPLVGVRGLAEHLLLSIDRGWEITNEKIRDKAKLIIEQADRMVHIIEHIRIFARDAGKPELRPVNVNNVVKSSIDMLGTQLRSRGIELICEFTDDMVLVSANPFSLEEVIINLLINARDAVEQRMAAKSGAMSPQIILRTLINQTASEENAIIEVRDSGNGIPEHIIDRVFDPFFTTKEPDKGTGLGLSISRSIVEGFGGTIQIKSIPDSGTTVVISLPVRKPDSLKE